VVKHLLWVGVAGCVLGGCSVSPDAPESNATLSGQPAIRSSRAAQGDTFHGAPQHKWTITLGTIEGCAGDDMASVEINTVSGVSDIPIGVTAVRAEENVVAALPSAFIKIAGQTVTGGSVTIDAGGSFIMGSWTATTPSGDITATFGAPVCP
jgi:hypothetical protein